MRTLARYMLASGGFLAMSVLVGSGTPRAAMADPRAAPVEVVNTPTVNVASLPAVTGNVAITGTPTVQAGQSGAWNVGITGTPTVNVGSLPAGGLSVGGNVGIAVQHPFEELCTINLPDGDGFDIGQTAEVVPAGKRAVIEFVSAECVLPTGQQLLTVDIEPAAPSWTSTGALTGFRLALSYVKVGTNVTGLDDYVASQQVRAYVEAGNPLGCVMGRDQDKGPAQCSFLVHGYLVDAP